MGLTLDEAEAEAEVLDASLPVEEEAPLPVEEEAPPELVDETPVIDDAPPDVPVTDSGTHERPKQIELFVV